MYRKARMESLAKSLVLQSDDPPCAKDAPRQPEFYEELKKALDNYWCHLNKYDIDFHLRRAFHFLYELYDKLENERDDKHKSVVMAAGRTIKTLKVIRAKLLQQRDLTVQQYFKDYKSKTDPAKRAGLIRDFLSEFSNLLRADAPHWCGLDKAIEAALKKDRSALVQELAGRFGEPLDTCTLSEIAKTTPGNGKSKQTILESLQRLLAIVVREDGLDISDFYSFDQTFYPLQYI